MASAYTFALMGLVAHQVRVEASTKEGIPSLDLIGLPEPATKETLIRIRSSITDIAALRTRVRVALTPEDLPKHGYGYDLPIAIATLSEIYEGELERSTQWAFFGELSLSGEVRAVRGILPRVLEAKKQGFRGVVVPWANAEEAAIVDGIEVRAADTLKNVVSFLNGNHEALDLVGRSKSHPMKESFENFSGLDPAGIEALKIAAVGGHNILFVGSPGSGATLLARSLPFIMPPLTTSESLEATAVHSVAGLLHQATPRLQNRPFRVPHHTCSGVGLFGGGDPARPGEVSLAHHGVLLLENINEFSQATLSQLREPMEHGTATVCKKSVRMEFPAKFTFAATMDPCPCGGSHSCQCTPSQISRHMGRIPVWMRDHIDLCVSVKKITSESTHTFAEMQSEISKAIDRRNDLDPNHFVRAISDYGYSKIEVQRLCEVARTICAIRQESSVSREHIDEALALRPSY